MVSGFAGTATLAVLLHVCALLVFRFSFALSASHISSEIDALQLRFYHLATIPNTKSPLALAAGMILLT